MLRILSFLRVYRSIVLFFLLCIIGVFFSAFSSSKLATGTQSIVLGLVAYPVRLAGWPLKQRNPAVEEYRELKQICLELSLENSYLRERERENIRLRQLLDLKENSRYTYLPVEVIGNDPDNITNSVVIRGGDNGGIIVDMPVVVAEGLVGKVTNISWNSAVVQLLKDQNARVSCVVQRSRVAGILEWTGDVNARLKNITKRDDVEEGDRIITSGEGGVYPKGILVGTVVAIDGTLPGLFKEIGVCLAVDFSYLEELFIILAE